MMFVRMADLRAPASAAGTPVAAHIADGPDGGSTGGHTGGAQARDLGLERVDVDEDSIPATGRLPAAVGHRPRPRRAGTAQDEAECTTCDGRERRTMALEQLEAEVLRVERDGSIEIRYLVAH